MFRAFPCGWNYCNRHYVGGEWVEQMILLLQHNTYGSLFYLCHCNIALFNFTKWRCVRKEGVWLYPEGLNSFPFQFWFVMYPPCATAWKKVPSKITIFLWINILQCDPKSLLSAFEALPKASNCNILITPYFNPPSSYNPSVLFRATFRATVYMFWTSV